MYTERITENLAIVADGIHSASQSTSEKLTSYVDLAKVRRVLFLIDSGTLGSSGTLDFQVKGATTSGGTYTAITGTAITQLVVASNNNQYALVEVTAEGVQALGLGYRYIKGSLVPGTAASNSAVVVFGEVGSYEPQSLSTHAGVGTTIIAQTVVL